RPFLLLHFIRRDLQRLAAAGAAATSLAMPATVVVFVDNGQLDFFLSFFIGQIVYLDFIFFAHCNILFPTV
ncbi:hypothetical protein, partial [Neisseria oralis]|uniref:hypothetical protein n=1 Tax=Neisseria oralis TaxID=1107316 RepID=UPI0027DFEB31